MKKQGRKPNKFLVLLFIVLCLSIIFSKYSIFSTRISEESVGLQMPDLDLIDMNNESRKISLHEVMNDSNTKRAVIFVIGSWCRFCHAEIPKYERITGSEFTNLISINWDKDGDAAYDMVNKPSLSHIKYNMLYSGNDFKSKIGIESIPNVFLVNKDGTIHSHYLSKLYDQDIDDIIKFIKNE